MTCFIGQFYCFVEMDNEVEDWSKEQEANRKPGQKHPTPSPVREIDRITITSAAETEFCC